MLDTREKIRTATEAAALHSWWSTDDERRIRRDILTVEQGNELAQFCSARIKALKSSDWQVTPVGPSTRKALTLPQQAGMLCSTGSFQTWLGVKTIDEAADIIRSRCGVTSRSEIRAGSSAAIVFESIVGDYEGWLEAEKAGAGNS
jgi:hypothetical protein